MNEPIDEFWPQVLVNYKGFAVKHVSQAELDMNWERKEQKADEDYSNHAGAVKSPMVGVVYLSADPNSPDYVKIGSSVAEGDTVCLIEAMKTFNPVKAHKGGKVSKILVASGDPVEYGEPLIIIE